jgi:hypothetical protein
VKHGDGFCCKSKLTDSLRLHKCKTQLNAENNNQYFEKCILVPVKNNFLHGIFCIHRFKSTCESCKVKYSNRLKVNLLFYLKKWILFWI